MLHNAPNESCDTKLHSSMPPLRIVNRYCLEISSSLRGGKRFRPGVHSKIERDLIYVSALLTLIDNTLSKGQTTS